jgi:hypothetical protein
MENFGVLHGIWYFYCCFGMCYSNLVCLRPFWYICPNFGSLHQEKSRNSDSDTRSKFLVLLLKASSSVKIYAGQLRAGANPTTASLNASAVKSHIATSSLVRFENKNAVFYFEKTL